MQWEHDLLCSLRSLRSPFMDWVMSFFSAINDHGYVCIALAVILIIFRRTRRTGLQVFMSIALAYILANLIIKNIVARPRPYEVYADLIPLIGKPHDTSFPSGHAVSAFAAATAVFFTKKKFGVLALIIAVIIAFSRLYNLVHFPTDVLAGAAIGIIMAVLVNYFFFPWAEKGVNRLRKKKAE